MKKTLLSIIVCLVCGLTYAEDLNPVHTIKYQYGRNLIPSEYPSLEYIIVDKSTENQVIVEYRNADDFSLAQQVNFSVTDSILYVDATLYNQYLLIVCKEYNSDEYHTHLYNTKGNLIFDFGEDIYFEEGPEKRIYTVAPDKLLLILHQNGEGGWPVYELFYYITITTTETGTQNVQVEKKAAFPCPARGEVNIPTRGQQGDLRVLNLNGQVLDAQRIQEGDYQRVNTESYPAGTYIYQAGNETGKFMVE